jgi:peptidoglycan-N-acetylglucosamine deacetylase
MSALGWSFFAAVKLAGFVVTLTGSPWIGVALFIAPDLLVLLHLFAPAGAGLGEVLTRFETSRSEIWLTIDDGPDESDTPRILDALDRYGAKATFFLIGERAERHPGIVAEILRRGHDVAHHTHTHPVSNFWCATPARVRTELDRALAALRLGGAAPRWFRAPVGIKNPFLGPELARRGLRYVGWSIRSHDTSRQEPAIIVQRVLEQIRPGTIVLMHEGDCLSLSVRVHAIEQLLEALAARQFSCVLPAEQQLR